MSNIHIRTPTIHDINIIHRKNENQITFPGGEVFNFGAKVLLCLVVYTDAQYVVIAAWNGACDGHNDRLYVFKHDGSYCADVSLAYDIIYMDNFRILDSTLYFIYTNRRTDAKRLFTVSF